MKSILFSLFFVIISVQLSAQTEVKAKATIFEMNNQWNGFPIEAYEYDFGQKVTDFEIFGPQMLVQIRNTKSDGSLQSKGKLVMFDFLMTDIVWQQDINYNQESAQKLGDFIALKSNGNKKVLNSYSGDLMYSTDKDFVFVNDRMQIGLAYSNSNPSILQAYNLTDGTKIWEKRIDQTYGWNDAFLYNDSTLMISASGLHQIDMRTGKGWDYAALSGKSNIEQQIMVGVGIMTIGFFTGVYFPDVIIPSVNWNMVSNVLQDDNYFYQAYSDKVVKLNSSGEVIWETDLPNRATSKSDIFIEDNQLVMINRGYAFKEEEVVNQGTPFLAKFDLKNGSQLLFKELTDERRSYISDFYINNDILNGIINHEIAQYSLNDGSLIKKSISSKLEHFVGENQYVKVDNQFKLLFMTDTTQNYAMTDKKEIKVFNKYLILLNDTKVPETYQKVGGYEDYSVLQKGKQYVVINTKGNVLVEFETDKLPYFLGETIYYINGNKIFEWRMTSLAEE